MLGDSDSNLHLREDVKERLRRSLEQPEGSPGVPIEDVIKKPDCAGNALSSLTQAGSA